jgi:hypothetical protein
MENHAHARLFMAAPTRFCINIHEREIPPEEILQS